MEVRNIKRRLAMVLCVCILCASAMPAALAEDVVQDSFMKLWEEVEYIAYDKAKSFLFSTAYHRMIDVLRRETKFGDIENVADRAGDVQEGYTGLQEILDMALEKLPPVQKTVILLRDYEAYSYEEIAGITGLNE